MLALQVHGRVVKVEPSTGAMFPPVLVTMKMRFVMERPRVAADSLRTSFWFVPSLMGLASIVLTVASFAMDKRLASSRISSPLLYVGDPADAQSVLATLLASMITMASLVFSITMVVLTLAASQFGPRLIRSFMANLQTQIVLGVFVMTIVYCLLALPGIEAREITGRQPYLSVSVALALTVFSVALLILFLDTLARSIVSETVIGRVGHDLDHLIEGFLTFDADCPEVEVGQEAPADLERRASFFGSEAAGYVQAVEFEGLVELAEKNDVLVILYFRAGHYVVPGAPEIGVYPKERLTNDLANRIKATIITGVHRTPIQDPDFSIRHLDEIGVRALSTAINDPYTAVAVIDRLSASLSKLMARTLPSGIHRDSAGRPRVLSTATSYEGLLGAAFNQIRQYGAATPIIVLHLLEAIERIAHHVVLPMQHAALCIQASAIMKAAHQRITDDFDRERIGARHARLQRALDAARCRCGSGNDSAARP